MSEWKTKISGYWREVKKKNKEEQEEYINLTMQYVNNYNSMSDEEKNTLHNKIMDVRSKIVARSTLFGA